MVFIYETVGFFKSPPRLMVHHGAPWAMGLEVMFRKNWKWMCLPREMNPWGYDPTGNAIYHLGDFQITGGNSNIFLFSP